METIILPEENVHSINLNSNTNSKVNIESKYLKEKFEMMKIIKEFINSSSFEVKQEMFSKDYIKQLLKNNPDLKKMIFTLKEKNKSQLNNNKNTLHMLKSNDFKFMFETKFVLNNLISELTFMHNEPSFIESLNKNIFDLVIKSINSNISTKKIGISLLTNGNSTNNNLMINNKKENIITSQINISPDHSTAIDSSLNKNDSNNIDMDLDIDEPDFKGNFKPKDLIKSIISYKNILDELYRTKSSNLISNNEVNNKSNNKKFNFKFKILDFNWYFKTYSNLIDNLINSSEENINNKKRREQIFEALKDNNKLSLLELCYKGVPPSLRKEIYCFFLGIDFNSISELNEESIDLVDNMSKVYNEELVLVIDLMFQEDLKVVIDTENFFLMIDMFNMVLKRLVRDHSLLFEIQGNRPLIMIPKSTEVKSIISDSKSTNNSNSKEYIVYPPSGIIPFQGFCFLIGPFMYLSTSFSEVYTITSKFYTKYLIKTTCFSSDSNSVISLIYNFENILSTLFADVKANFNKINFDINAEVLKWFGSGFAEVLSIQDVFIIYDLILLTDSLHIFVVVALSIVNYKRSEMVSASNGDDVNNSIFYLKFEEIRILDLIKSLFS